ncbi:MAG: Ribosomal silencing factor RsfS [Alphaproteobacteria bacterium MarineAlpha2_Bin1]|nr:MAG: Ribosomal silencing factor RsfS [Alphaproteobacteria bacterium MarineAlpha2_Bin1]|tara:strand:- start:1511 stop:1906 length:396 start_codon:yes stop_codon:yes gene_type:complete
MREYHQVILEIFVRKIFNLLKDAIINSLENDKALDVKVIDLRKKTFIADEMIIASGTSRRHIISMAEHIKENLHKRSVNVKIEGMKKSEWILIDCNNVIVNIFLPEIRSYYNLEKVWDFQIKDRIKNQENN